MVAQNAQLGVPSAECLESRNPRFRFIAVVIDQISSEAKQIWIQLPNHFQPGLYRLKLL